YVGTYHQNPQVYHRSIPAAQRPGMAWPENVPLPIRGDRPNACVTAEVTLDDEEKAISGGLDKARVGIRIDKSGESFVTHADGNMANFFKHFDPGSRVGVVDYISPNRTFPRQRVENINLNAVSVNQQRLERIELPRPNYDAYHKFRTVKDFLISLAVEEF